MRLFGVKMQQYDWFRMGHSDWLLGWGQFGPFCVMWSDCGQVLVTWLRQWWLSCAKNRNPLCVGGSIFGNIKWRNNIKDFVLLNKNMVVVFNLTMFGGIRDALCIRNVCRDFIVAVLFKHQWGAPCGPWLDCTRVVNIQMMGTVAYMGVPVLMFPRGGQSGSF